MACTLSGPDNPTRGSPGFADGLERAQSICQVIALASTSPAEVNSARAGDLEGEAFMLA